MKRVPVDLRETANEHCRKCRNKSERRTENGVCTEVASAMDRLPVRCVGSWASQKIYFLNQYFGIFGNSMKNRWDGKLDYFEICSGPGRCVLREKAIEIDGTALAVIRNNAFQHFHSATFLDISTTVVETLNRRLTEIDDSGRSKAFWADYNMPDQCVEIVKERSSGGLNLVFVDPTDCSIPFETIARIAAALNNVDFIINVATGTDANRNMCAAFDYPDSMSRQKYVRFLGSADFFQDTKNRKLAEQDRHKDLRNQFREAYQNELERIGYKHFALERVEHYYDLMFACRHPLGLEFWRKAQIIRPNDQTTFSF